MNPLFLAFLVLGHGAPNHARVAPLSASQHDFALAREYFNAEVVPRLNRARNTEYRKVGAEEWLIAYDLPESAYVTATLRMSRSPTQHVRVLSFRALEGPGRHEIRWDGRDQSGLFLGSGPTFLVINTEPPTLSIPADIGEIISQDLIHRIGHLHGLHPPGTCGQFDLRIVDPEPEAVLGGGLNVLVALASPFRGLSPTWGMGLRLYIDGEPYDEIMLAPGAFDDGRMVRMTIDTQELQDGPHVIAFDMCDLNMHVGAASVPVEIRNAVVEPDGGK